MVGFTPPMNEKIFNTREMTYIPNVLNLCKDVRSFSCGPKTLTQCCTFFFLLKQDILIQIDRVHQIQAQIQHR
jgi:hypothetical protein